MDEGEDPEWERHGRKRVSWTLEYPESDQTNLVVRHNIRLPDFEANNCAIANVV